MAATAVNGTSSSLAMTAFRLHRPFNCIVYIDYTAWKDVLNNSLNLFICPCDDALKNSTISLIKDACMFWVLCCNSSRSTSLYLAQCEKDRRERERKRDRERERKIERAREKESETEG